MFVAAVATSAMTGCKRHPLIGLHCEGGVKDGDRPQGGDCIDIKANKPDTNPDTVGSAVIASAYKVTFVVRRTSTPGKYELRYDDRAMGFIEHSDVDLWLHVTLTEVPKDAERLEVGKRMAFRDDMPSIFQ